MGGESGCNMAAVEMVQLCRGELIGEGALKRGLVGGIGVAIARVQAVEGINEGVK